MSIIKPPPPAFEYDKELIDDIVTAEARKQYNTYYPYTKGTLIADEKVAIRMIENGILNMLRTGAATITGELILFWNPRVGGYQEYDADYNNVMMDILNDFLGRSPDDKGPQK